MKSLAFGNFYELVDALMLFGAQIERVRGGECRLKAQRSRRLWPSLAWAVIVAESQDPAFDFLIFRSVVVSSSVLVMTTGSSRFLKHSHARWYPHGETQIPSDLVLDERLLAFWLVGSFSRWKGQGDLFLKGPKGVGEGLAGQVGKLLAVRASVKRGTVRIAKADAGAVKVWLESRVPTRVWQS